ncbi:hypothetical protein [Burkholderia stabilis]
MVENAARVKFNGGWLMGARGSCWSGRWSMGPEQKPERWFGSSAKHGISAGAEAPTLVDREAWDQSKR